MKTIKSECSSFLAAVSESNEKIYLGLLTVYVLIYFIIHTAWIGEFIPIVDMVQYSLLSIVMWGTGLYLFLIIIEWKKLLNRTVPLVLTGIVILLSIYLFTKNMSTNLYGAVMDIVFCILAYGKYFKKMVKCVLGVTASYLLFAFIAMHFEITADLGKPDTAIPGHSLGIDYPNTWGYLVFLGLIILWYLYLRAKPIITFIVFWGVSAFMYLYIICRTIAGITLVFPFLAFLINVLERRADKRAGEEANGKVNSILDKIIIGSPFIAFAFMMFLSMQYKWMHQFYHGPLRNLAWRFIQSGLYFITYGLPLVGNPYHSNEYTYVNVNGEFIQVGILDSSFASYIIMRGMLWLAYTLLWLCIAQWKALKKRDYAIILIEIIFLGFAMMERPGLEMWYNFVLLYPLAKVVSKPNTERVLEFAGGYSVDSPDDINSCEENDISDGKTESEDTNKNEDNTELPETGEALDNTEDCSKEPVEP